MDRTTLTSRNTQQNIPDLGWVEHISHLMDSKFQIPGTKFRFGLDPILGLLPGLGDVASMAVSAVLIFHMARYGASRKLVILMAGNVLLDTIIGSIPFLGNIFDFFSKANDRNLRLMKRHYQEGKYQGSGTGIVIIIVIAMLAVLGLILYGTWALIAYMIHLAH